MVQRTIDQLVSESYEAVGKGIGSLFREATYKNAFDNYYKFYQKHPRTFAWQMLGLLVAVGYCAEREKLMRELVEEKTHEEMLPIP